MPLQQPVALLGGLSPQEFMRRHWQRRPLLVRGAFDPNQPPLPVLQTDDLFRLATQPDVESRLIVRDGPTWQVRHGPLPRRALPPRRQPGWTVLVQGVDLHVPAAHELLNRFRFISSARLDDAMISWASDGGGVGPHVDSYDVFLVQIAGRRRWRVGHSADRSLRPGLPLKILRRFEPQHDWLLEPGDLLYLPPQWAHDGTAEGPCMTCSIGFRAPRDHELGTELLARLADLEEPVREPRLFSDAGTDATAQPGRVPADLQRFAQEAVDRLLAQPLAVQRALGEWLTEPKPRVWFQGSTGSATARRGVVLARATRMLYDRHFVFINGESYRAAGTDAELMRRLADGRRLPAPDVVRLSRGARALLREWIEQGWVEVEVR